MLADVELVNLVARRHRAAARPLALGLQRLRVLLEAGASAHAGEEALGVAIAVATITASSSTAAKPRCGRRETRVLRAATVVVRVARAAARAGVRIVGAGGGRGGS